METKQVYCAVGTELSCLQTVDPCALIYDPQGSSNSPFHLPQQKAFANTAVGVKVTNAVEGAL